MGKNGNKIYSYAAVLFAVILNGWAQADPLPLANDYVAGLNTDTTNTVEAARNFAAILDGPLTGSSALTLKGGYASASSSMLSLINNAGNTFSGDLVVDVDGGALRLAGNLYAAPGTAQQGVVLPGLTAANTLNVRRGAMLLIDDNVSGMAGYVADRLGTPGNRPGIRLEGGTLRVSGPNVATLMTTQTVGVLTLGPGPSSVDVVRNNATATPKLAADSLTPELGATVNFTGTSLGTAAANVGQILFNMAPTLVGGILPGYARTGNEWATNGANGVTALASGSYGSTIQGAAATANIKVAAAQTISGDNTINSLNWNYGGNLDLTTYRLTLVSGGYLKQNNAANQVIGTTGYVTAGAGTGGTTALNVYQNANQTLTWSALVKDNPAGSGNTVAFVKDGSGPGTVSFTQADDNSYSGGTFVNTGTLRTGGTAGRRYLGAGPARVDNATLSLGATGATSYAEADRAGYTAVNGGQIVIANASFTSPGDRFHIGAGCILSGNATTTAGNGLNSIARVAGLAGISGGQAVLAPGAIVAFGGTLTTGLGAGVLTLASGAGPDADLYFGLAANAAAASTITVGTGTPWRGISTDRAARNFTSGTLTANGDFDLRGFAAPGAAPVVLNMGSGGAMAIATPNGDVAVNILGAVTWTTAATALGSANHNLIFTVKPGATFTVTPANALGASAGSTVAVVVERGGTLAIGNAAALNAPVTIRAGGRLLANQAGGLTGTGALTFESGSILEITHATGFSGSQAAAATLQPGVVVRLNVANFGSAAAPLDMFLADRSPVYEIYGANRAPANPSSAGATVMTLNRGGDGAGGMLVNDLASRTFTAAANGKIAIGTNGGVMGATANTTLTVPYSIALGTNELVIGSPAVLDGAPPKNGTVDLSAASFSAAEAGSRISIRSGTLKVTGNILPSVTDVSVASPGVLNLTAAGTNAVRYLTVDGVKYFAGVYGSNSLPRHITGPGRLQTEAPPELICWIQPDKVMGVTNETVTFWPLLSGNNTNIIAYVWDVDDDGSIESTLPTVSTHYATGGVYRVRLTVTNENSESATFLWEGFFFIYPHNSRTWSGAGANVYASTVANWVGGEAPQPGDHIVLNAGSAKPMTWDLDMPVQSWTQVGYMGTVTVATVYPGQGAFTNFTILGDCVISNGVWTHIANPVTVTNVNNELYRLRVSVGGNMTVGPEATVDVSSRGYAAQKGPGTPTPNGGGSGGSHGGRGAIYTTAIPGPCYGSVTRPVNLGSGGGRSAGGGALFLTVKGSLRHDGLMASNGRFDSFHTGAGGSVFLVAGTFTGAGIIQANYGTDSGSIAPGGGGRVAVALTDAGADFSSFTGTLEALGRATGTKSASGTIYLEKAADAPEQGELVVKGTRSPINYDWRTDLDGPDETVYAFSRITFTNAGVLGVAGRHTLNLSNTVIQADVADPNVGLMLMGGAVLTRDDFSLSNFTLTIGAPGSTFSPGGTFVVGENAEFRVDQPHVMTSRVVVADGAKLTHTPNPSSMAEWYKLDLVLDGSLIIESNGVVDVSARGYPMGYGPGMNPAINSGSSHGGLGVGGLSCYGSLVAPTNLGSGGRYAGSTGGGAAALHVSGVISNGGAIRANAASVTYRTGAGGSIGITCGKLMGEGPIEANSAINVTGDSPGGGGRVAVAVTNEGENVFAYAGPITAYGGRKPESTAGGAGTVYLRMPGEGLYEGTLIVDNDDLTGLGTEISASVTETAVAHVRIQREGHLLVNTNQTLTVSGIWSNNAHFTARTDGTIRFDGASGSTSTLFGSTAFKVLRCEQPGKTLVFEAAAINTLTEYGRLILRGDAASKLVLRSTVDGTAWNLNADPLTEQDIEFVDVKDSDASGGVEVIAKNSVGEHQNTINWKFVNVTPGETITWTGDSNTLWGVAENWDRARAPAVTDRIVISGGRSNYPVFDAARTVNALEIQSDGAIYLNGYDLTVTNDFVNEGALYAAETETVTLRGDATFTGGTFTPVRSSLVLSGDVAQAVNLGGLTFYKVRVDNSSDMVSLSGGFSATELRCEAPSGEKSLAFEAGKTVRLRDLVLRGTEGATNITLTSTSPGSKWNLAVTGYRSVYGVKVSDSDARPGVPIPAMDSEDGGGNENWQFGVAPAVWTPTSGNNFHTAANWTPEGVPGAGTRVLVEGANPMVITGTVSISDLVVGGGADAASVTVNAALTVGESVCVLKNGALVWNQPGVVSNDVVVASGGLLTHSANGTTEANKIDLTVLGDVDIEVGGTVDVLGKGYQAGAGPGGATYGNTSGGTYGGKGGIWYTDYTKPCYGSIVAPTNCGSGGGNGAGGGVILMSVKGSLRVDGEMVADGVKSGSYYSGSGGTISLRAEALRGVGVIRAKGGDYSSTTSPGGGGRIALVLTGLGADFDAFAGTIHVQGGLANGAGAPLAGAGTIYLQTGADRPGRGRVMIENGNATAGVATDVPSYTNDVPGEADRAVFHVANGARLRLTNNFMVGDIWMDTENAVLDLGGNTLTVNAREHELGLGSVTNYGAIVWKGLPPGALIIVK